MHMMSKSALIHDEKRKCGKQKNLVQLLQLSTCLRNLDMCITVPLLEDSPAVLSPRF